MHLFLIQHRFNYLKSRVHTLLRCWFGVCLFTLFTLDSHKVMLLSYYRLYTQVTTLGNAKGTICYVVNQPRLAKARQKSYPL